MQFADLKPIIRSTPLLSLQFVSMNLAKCVHCGNTAGKMASYKSTSGQPVASSTHPCLSSQISDIQLKQSMVCCRRRADPKFTSTKPTLLGRVINFVSSQNTPSLQANRNGSSISGHLCTMTLFLLLLLSLSTCSSTLISKSSSASLPTSGLDIVSRCQQNCPQQLVSTL